jgi:hypothetical protein
MNNRPGLNLLEHLASGLNKDDIIIKTLLSDENGNGAIANELSKLVDFITYYSRTDNVKNHRGKTLEMIAKLFARLQRRVNETDDILLRRLLALTYRQGDTIWGNPLNLKHIFETYFNGIICYVAENTNEISLLLDGSFEDNQHWVLGGTAKFDYEARFSDLRGLMFNGSSGESCTQNVRRLFSAGNYTFHFMLYGKCGVTIRRGDGKYWNANEQEFSGDIVLDWMDEKVVNIFDSPYGWENVFCFLVLPNDLNELTITLEGIDGARAFIDHARLFVKPLNPSYTLIMQYQGFKINPKTLHIGESAEEPIHGLDYYTESYYDNAFIIGPIGVSQSQTFTSLLDSVRPRGIQAFVEFVEKGEKEGEFLI